MSAVPQNLMLLDDIRKTLPGDVQVGTITRWALRGVLDAGRVRVFLRTWRIKNKRYTTPEELSKFLDAVSTKSIPEKSGPRRGRKAKDLMPADHELSRAGLL